MQVACSFRDVDAHVIGELSLPCWACVYWEAPRRSGLSAEQARQIKSEWYNQVTSSFGSCGKLLLVDGQPIAYAQYAPASLLPQAAEYAEALVPSSAEAILISCLYVFVPDYRRQGWGSELLAEMVQELRVRGYKAVETYARDDLANNCSGPTRFYLANGFQAVASNTWQDMSFSLMRLEL